MHDIVGTTPGHYDRSLMLTSRDKIASSNKQFSWLWLPHTRQFEIQKEEKTVYLLS